MTPIEVLSAKHVLTLRRQELAIESERILVANGWKPTKEKNPYYRPEGRTRCRPNEKFRIVWVHKESGTRRLRSSGAWEIFIRPIKRTGYLCLGCGLAALGIDDKNKHISICERA